ncbi:uncharacterized protein AB675_4813 [Cyphellophora attinorum]|uniref:Heterokaryon incompatibility domain-containing protein n=1 Tax=Cyphellophora attinorum TaxID=1664694 RepID=A0A0N1H2P7_9EURO|nr:uncharacterized protein AB675_4813 [Phialophora attinorum]KPI35582.1 hypothetical protein AB675_4813 [Phialophora attinorum]
MAKASLAPSIYTPLKPWETRLIELLPGAFGDDIECHLQVAVVTAAEGLGLVNDNKQQVYEAISYTWGYPELTAPVICNGVTTYVPPPLSTALKYLRLQSESRYLWCDALCIDQANLAEKSIQVQAIWRIFDKAKRVVGWLGEFDEQTAARLDENEILIFDLPYFSRCWVRAEIVNIDKVVFQYNHKTVNPLRGSPGSNIVRKFSASSPIPPGLTAAVWKRVVLLSTDHEEYFTSSTQVARGVRLTTAAYDRLRFTVSFVELMLSNQLFECTDRRDIVYSFAPRLQNQWTHVLDIANFMKLRTDYDISFEELQQVVIKFVMNLQGDYRLLYWFRSADQHRTCSWQPSWNELADSRGQPSVLYINLLEPDPLLYAENFTYQDLKPDGRLRLCALPIGFCSSPQALKIEPPPSQWLTSSQEYQVKYGSDLRFWSVSRAFLREDLILESRRVAEPGSAQAGDAIVVPCGSESPCIIRRLTEHTWQFVSYARWVSASEASADKPVSYSWTTLSSWLWDQDWDIGQWEQPRRGFRDYVLV